jgi:hypothetical protein
MPLNSKAGNGLLRDDESGVCAQRFRAKKEKTKTAWFAECTDRDSCYCGVSGPLKKDYIFNTGMVYSGRTDYSLLRQKYNELSR